MNIMHASISEVPLVSLVLEKLFIPFVRPDTVPLSADQTVASAESHLSLHNSGGNYKNYNTRGAAREGEPE